MTETVAEQKVRVRKECRQMRQVLGEAFRARSSQAICAKIEDWPIFQKAHVILGYMPVKAEVDLRSLLERYPGKSWVLPRILPEENHTMCFHPYDPQRLTMHPFGMAEPAADLPVVSAQQIELALVPGLAFDRNGWRLGYGGGYYDRFLREFGGVSLGIVFDALLLENLPRDRHDVPVQWLVSEEKLYPTRPT